MHNIGEKIVYSGAGVMTVVDIREEAIAGEKRKYYVLRADGAPSSSLTFVPVDNEKLTSQMRRLLSREEIEAIIDEARSRPDEEWIADNRQRSERFKHIIESGDRAGMISMIGAIYKNGEAREAEGKKNFLADENAMKRAERLLYSEFSAVLGIPESEVVEYIKSRMTK